MSRVSNTVWFQADHTDEGLWYISGNRRLTKDPLGIRKLQQWSLTDNVAIIDDAIVPAMLGNARLLRALYAQHIANRISRLWLMPPANVKLPAGGILLPAENEKDIDKLLRQVHERMRPSQGGQRRVTQVDLDTFSLPSNEFIYREGHPVLKCDIMLAERHPGWPLLSFIKTCEPHAAANLLSLILDPRWYVDPLNPDRQHRLRDAFGLGEKGVNTMLAIQDGEPVGAKHRAMWAKLVVDTWYSAERRDKALYAGSSTTFPWPLYFKLAEKKSPAEALLITSRVVLQTVCAVWLDNLTPPREYTTVVDAVPGKWASAAGGPRRLEPSKVYNPQLFVPAYCFSPSEQAEWRRHISAWRSAHSTW